VGPDGEGFKRDPWARELEGEDYESRDGIVRDPNTYPWHDGGFRAPAPRDLIVYQFHIGVFFARDEHGADLRPHRTAKLLDAVQRVPYLAELGVTAVQPLPFAEFQTPSSLGYNGTDIFSPETDYSVPAAELDPYLLAVNALLTAKGYPPLARERLESQVNQLKAFVDLCHLYGLAVIADVVYNHAGGDLDASSLDHFDWKLDRDLYFSGEHAGGQVFDYRRDDVQEFLISNARMLLREYHVDGLRFDQVTVITEHERGCEFFRNLTTTLHFEQADAPLIAEFWRDDRWRAVTPPPEGLGLDIGYSDRLRDAVRTLIATASGGASAALDLGALRIGLERPWGVPFTWQVYNCIENHDLNWAGVDGHNQLRIPSLADHDRPRSWYARSRARVATGLLLTAPGVPMLLMGQEFLEDKLWSDSPDRPDLLIWWDGEEGADEAMADQHLFTRELIRVRRRHPALRADPIVVYDPDNANRVQAFHRWVPGEGRDVLVVATLNESSLYGYQLGFPQPGRWLEVFNSDEFDHFPNPWVQGNAGSATADGPPLHGMAQSAALTIPANSLLVFARDPGD
jgi:1,4-alpha-glucan branching enzyme